MVDHVGEQLAGRRLGLHALQQLIARRAQELDLDEGKALVERVDDRRFALGDVGRIEDELAFLARRLDQFGRTELAPAPAAQQQPSAKREAARTFRRACSLPIPVDLVPFFDPLAVERLEFARTSAPTPWSPWSCPAGSSGGTLQRGEVAVLLDRIDLTFLGELPFEVQPRGIRILRGLRNARTRRARSARLRAERRSSPARRRAPSDR